MKDGKYEYTEWSRCTALGLLILVVSVVLCVIGFFTNVGLFVVGLLGMSFVHPLGFSFGRYNKVLVSKDLLVVGRDVVPLGDLDSAFGAKPQDMALTPGQRQMLEVVTPRRYKSSELAMLGGSWAKPFGTKLVVIRRKNGTFDAIATRHDDELVGALNRVLATRPSGPETT